MMIHPQPPIFFKVTPVNPIGMTVVDLGEMDNVLPVQVARHSSLPPVTETRSQLAGEHSFAGGRHRSLPPKTVTISATSPTTIEDSETDGERDHSANSVDQLEPSPTKGKRPITVGYL
jgi:hypothetical protein